MNPFTSKIQMNTLVLLATVLSAPFAYCGPKPAVVQGDQDQFAANVMANIGGLMYGYAHNLAFVHLKSELVDVELRRLWAGGGATFGNANQGKQLFQEYSASAKKTIAESLDAQATAARDASNIAGTIRLTVKLDLSEEGRVYQRIYDSLSIHLVDSFDEIMGQKTEYHLSFDECQSRGEKVAREGALAIIAELKKRQQ